MILSLIAMWTDRCALYRQHMILHVGGIWRCSGRVFSEGSPCSDSCWLPTGQLHLSRHLPRRLRAGTPVLQCIHHPLSTIHRTFSVCVHQLGSILPCRPSREATKITVTLSLKRPEQTKLEPLSLLLFLLVPVDPSVRLDESKWLLQSVWLVSFTIRARDRRKERACLLPYPGERWLGTEPSVLLVERHTQSFDLPAQHVLQISLFFSFFSFTPKKKNYSKKKTCPPKTSSPARPSWPPPPSWPPSPSSHSPAPFSTLPARAESAIPSARASTQRAAPTRPSTLSTSRISSPEPETWILR